MYIKKSSLSCFYSLEVMRLNYVTMVVSSSYESMLWAMRPYSVKNAILSSSIYSFHLALVRIWILKFMQITVEMSK